MHIALGIDTGGTYTDAVLVDQNTGHILATTKSLTTHRDLSIGITQAITRVFTPSARPKNAPVITPKQVAMVGLSTTLATNAIVEGQGSPVCMFLIGYDPILIEQHNFERELVTSNIVYLPGGHDVYGNEIKPLDEQMIREATLAQRERVSAFAVSSYFSVRNPTHELRAKALIQKLTRDNGNLPHPVTCGHELSYQLDSIRRATTAALNARLISILRDLIMTVRHALDTHGIAAPLMIVKGDGSLVCSDWAIQRPVETILSGPAASIVGAWYLSRQKDVWVIDVGGTTTDIGALRNGQLRLNGEGAHIGNWRTMVEAADVHTVGLGGDSSLSLNVENYPKEALSIGPQRVLPLCRLGENYPEIHDALREQQHIQSSFLKPLVAQFVLQRRQHLPPTSEKDRHFLEQLHDGPKPLTWFAQQKAYRPMLSQRVARLTAQQAIMQAGFTPTDALHVLGHFQQWDTAAARLGASLLAERAGLSVEAFCETVITAMSDRITTELITKILHDEIAPPDWTREPAAAGFVARALGNVQDSDLTCQLTLQQPIVAVGAPVSAYLPRVAAHLHTELIIPTQASVANAIGAVAGSVIQYVEAHIRPLDFETAYRLHVSGQIPMEPRDFKTLEAATAYAKQHIPAQVRALAQQAGAGHVEIQITRDDHNAPVREREGDSVFLETILTFTAIGRPGLEIEK